MRALATLALLLVGCGRSQGISDQDLGGLVVADKPRHDKIDVDRAAKDLGELGRALMQPFSVAAAALGPHTVAISSATHVTEAGKPVEDLDDHTTIELGDKGAYHAVYTNSADYGRETIFAGGKLYLRPRYQRWHERAPETPDEPDTMRDSYYEAIAATWDLLAPGAEITDRGPAQVGGRAGRKIEIKPAPSQKTPPTETVAQRKWREKRTIEGLTGEVVLDADKGIPLSVKLSGTVGFTRDGRRFSMQVSVQADVSGVGTAVAVTAPPQGDVVATPERAREVDDRDYLLQGIAPPLRKNPDGTAIAPAPPPQAGSGSAAGSGSTAGSGSAAGSKSTTEPTGKK